MSIKLSQLRADFPTSSLDGTEIIEVTQGGVSKGALISQIPNIGNSNLKLTGNRIVDLDGNSLAFGDTLIVYGGGVSEVAITNVGMDYQVGDVLTVDAGDGNATITVTEIDGSGSIVASEITTVGSGYETDADVSLDGGSGTGARADITASNGTQLNNTTYLNGNAKLLANRIVDLDGNSLSIQQGGENLLLIDIASGQSFLKAFNNTDDGNYGYVNVTAGAADAVAGISAVFNNGVKSAFVEGFADASTSTLTYTADEHDIVGAIKTGGQATFTGSLADAITGTKQVVNGLIID